ncbi:AfsR/SARP family transcriptional regulator [Streptomyces sp. 4N509B]|uniref:AfsR/SARP family transcriptional regulator n=1 Tax=Streptomyces sp. 4N509B TaxID=3457413 RepID=UPI003FD15280
MEFCILGNVELRAHGRTHTLGSTKERLVCACLAYEAGRPVPADLLIDRVWEDTPPRNARGNLHPYISRLRVAIQSLAPVGGPHIRSRNGTYLLDVDPRSVDAHRHAGLGAEARRLADLGEDDRALRLLDEADRLWREPLAGLTGLWVENLRLALTHQYLAMALLRADIALRRGDFSSAVTLLSPLTVQHPADEALAERLMLALHGRGLTQQALSAFSTIRRRLRDDSASEPGERLRRLQDEILRGTPIHDLVPKPPRTSSARPSELPRPNTLLRRGPLVGRLAELHRIQQALTSTPEQAGDDIAVVSVTGMPGVGKTALALHAAHELREHYPDGQIYLKLHAHTGNQTPMAPEAALGSLLRTFHVSSAEIPTSLDAAASLWRNLLARRRAIVLLDDAAGLEQLMPLLPGSGSASAVIVTSRQRLTGLPGELSVSLEVLTEADAAALFRRTVGDGRGADSGELTEVIRRSDRLPLAIELLARRMISHPTWEVSNLLDRLQATERPLSEMRHGSKAVAQAFALSCERLSDTQRLVFRRLALHVGAEFDAYGVAALAGVGLGETEAVLDALLDGHLILEPVPFRYTTHDLLREYARTLVATEESGDQAAEATERLLDYFLVAADQADRLLYPDRPRIPVAVARVPAALPSWEDPSAAHRWFTRELDTLVLAAERAWEIGPPERAALFANAMGGFLNGEHHGALAESLHTRAVAYWRSTGNAKAEVRALLDLTETHTHAGNYPDAVAAAERALLLADGHDSGAVVSETLLKLATPCKHMGDLHRARELQQRALDLRRDAGDLLARARAENNLAVTLLDLGEHDAARVAFRNALDLLRETGEVSGQAILINNLGDLYMKTGEFALARASYEKALDLMPRHARPVYRATIQMNLAGLLLDFEESERALELYGESLKIFRHMGERRRELLVLNGIGKALRLTGRPDEALPHHLAALAMAREIGAALEETQVLIQIALTRLGLDDDPASTAVQHLEDALAIAERVQAATEAEEARKLLGHLRDASSRTAKGVPSS